LSRLLWTAQLKSDADRIALSDDGHLAAIDGKYIVFFDRTGRRINTVRGYLLEDNISYCCGRYGTINSCGEVFIYDTSGNLIKTLTTVYGFHGMMSLAPDGFLVCGTFSCRMFSYDGKMSWEVQEVYTPNEPAHCCGYWYIPNSRYKSTVMVVRRGDVLNEITDPISSIVDLAACGYYLAVATSVTLYLYDLSDPLEPELIWWRKFGTIRQVAFSPDCTYLAVADEAAGSIKVVGVSGHKQAELLLVRPKMWYDRTVVSVDWRGGIIAAGTEDGKIYALSGSFPRMLYTSRCS